MNMMMGRDSILKPCRHTPKLIANIDGVLYSCADKHGVVGFNGNAAINFTGMACIPQLMNIPQLAAHLDAQYEELIIAWPDFGLPKVKASFWQALHSYTKSKKWKKVCLHCDGGHGRTGTALASLLISVLKWDVPKAIKFIRKRYCEKAIESSEQCEYLCGLDLELNNRETDEKEIPMPSMEIMAVAAAKERDRMEKDKSNIVRIINSHMGSLCDEDDDG